MNTNRPLSGRRALITGSGQGLGLAIARLLAFDGCDVVVHGLEDATVLETHRAGIERESGVRALSSSADLRNPDEIARMVSTIERSLGSIDILVNNAVVRHTAPVEEFASSHWDEAIAVNLSAAFHTTRFVLPAMQRNRWGRIVNVSSIYGLRGAANRVGYVTTKTALIGLTRAVAAETASGGVTCNAVCPGTSESPVHEASLERLMREQGLTRTGAEVQLLTGKQPSGRLIPSDSVAHLVVFLCSEQASAITGAALPVDGGWSAV